MRVVAQEEIQLELSLGRMRGLLHDRSSIDAGGALLVRDVDALGRQSNLLLVAPTRKGCAVTRSFSDRVGDLATMEQAVASHAAELVESFASPASGPTA